MTAIRVGVLPTDPASVPSVWRDKLQRIEARVTAGEKEGLYARWECGMELLKQRKGKQLPKGLLDNVSREVGVNYDELRRRLRFADRYPNEDEVGHAMTSFPSWFLMVREGLRRKPATERLPPSPAKALLSRLVKIQAGEIKPEELALIQGELKRIAGK